MRLADSLWEAICSAVICFMSIFLLDDLCLAHSPTWHHYLPISEQELESATPSGNNWVFGGNILYLRTIHTRAGTQSQCETRGHWQHTQVSPCFLCLWCSCCPWCKPSLRYHLCAQLAPNLSTRTLEMSQTIQRGANVARMEIDITKNEAIPPPE